MCYAGMQALQIDKDYKYEVKVLPKPVAKPGQALVRVAAAALNHRDVWIGQVLALRLVPLYVQLSSADESNFFQFFANSTRCSFPSFNVGSLPRDEASMHSWFRCLWRC